MMLLRNDGRAQRKPPDRRSVRLLIVEQGAPTFRELGSPEDCDEVVVLRQAEGETPIDLVVRTCAQISNLEFAGKRVGQAVIALGPSLNPLFEETRYMLGLTILSHVQAVGDESELVLGMGETATEPVRERVMALVASLVAHPGSRHARIRARFAAAADMEHAPPLDSRNHPCLTVL